jgi:hypothetical protein
MGIHLFNDRGLRLSTGDNPEIFTLLYNIYVYIKQVRNNKLFITQLYIYYYKGDDDAWMNACIGEADRSYLESMYVNTVW